MDLATLADLLEKQPREQKKLIALHDSLKQIMRRLVAINEKNKNLIENSLEMIEFNMNFIQSTRMSPGVNNYDRNASSSYTPGISPKSFVASRTFFFRPGQISQIPGRSGNGKDEIVEEFRKNN